MNKKSDAILGNRFFINTKIGRKKGRNVEMYFFVSNQQKLRLMVQ